ncbi:Alpha-2-macroglobulin receptor-associated protein [Gryllus bimaculatus]|nr:Alpha-2-macroglobulin receptor-associated protein [Gryllus bimaculatus]
MRVHFVFLSIFVSLIMSQSANANKYSAEANIKATEPEMNFRTLQKPFRMSKLNLLWAKAQHRLTETKLKSLFGELKIHDKEELAFKKMKAEGLDKDGMQEAVMRKRLIGIMSTYGLLEHFQELEDPRNQGQHKAFNADSEDYINKSLFKDKKLNKLWEKAEQAGFTASELKALREEFNHHQDKIDQYYSLLKEVEGGPDNEHENSIDNKLDRFNSLDVQEEIPSKDYSSQVNSLRDQHRDIRDGYDRLHRIAARGPNSKEFIEPKVEGLWRLAVKSNFTPSELESLRVELMHYENRLLKLRHLQAEEALGAERKKAKAELTPGEKPEHFLDREVLIKKQARKVEKLHEELENRILSRHSEL